MYEFPTPDPVRLRIEFGSGDGNQASLFDFPIYTGVDVVPQVIEEARERFADRPGWSFATLEEYLRHPTRADLAMSLDVVYHLAGQPGVRASWGEEFDIYLAQNVLATQRLLEAVKEAPIKCFVLASSSSIYGQAESFPTREASLPRPVSPYGVSKLAAEHLAHLYHSAFGVPTVALELPPEK